MVIECVARSQSIPIQYSKDLIRAQEDMKFEICKYDLATWQMYHRIVNQQGHRLVGQNSRVPKQKKQEVTSPSSKEEWLKRRCQGFYNHTTAPKSTMSPSFNFTDIDMNGISQLEEDKEGEFIFQLDM